MTELPASVSSDESDVPSIPEAPAVIVPDRADAPVSEVTERFLRAVIAKVPLDRIEELHLFAPLRQSGVETGIAVVAARVPVATPVEVVVEAPHDQELGLDVDASTQDEVLPVAEDAPVHEERLPVVEEAPVHEEEPPVAEAAHDVPENDSPYLDDDANDGADDDIDDDAAVHAVHEGSESADAVVGAAASDVAPAVASPVDSEVLPVTPPAPPIVRHTVYTARYRLVLKGPERGKWEADVVDEADAPLVTVEMVVRGVQRRAGEETEILRYSDRQIAKALRMEWPLPIRNAANAEDVSAPATVG